ncbi:succinyldiaminopimelate transaminase [Bifidobacterium catenulatum subsp. kashiwanohense]|uniref:Succinyldiaminopimelate transaminase n=1 Tax=Bifidobacterium catenulatum subsp. kashiwanohense TaxID=630129 RepID=A0AAJ1UM64_9BIFI|nr:MULTISPECIES: succinyldiaminopimelate transaminase [Bifidobacterium]KFI63672.1 N-succinyldiaminopimelate aminotransferase [Bifidobacterium catenulatum subsp. kashiwanohense JCM 15439 = DSM 21854]MCB4897195.1 succinyldiaminopimelate transaminase [Bifidobacterium pseudocatenulatum]MDH7872584.1 succinyldiaminopimelate transaminase [Bifidobacterium catenulatum subsp. kashiwanohense]MDH7887389.1 succinyldiaminopimelate transaminase [Bifidobacterium catenulatum subsp. kashiwanohense]MDH7898978.1 
MGFHEFSSPYDWSRIAAYKRTAKAAFGGMIDLSVGSPVDPVPDSVRKALAVAANDPNAYGYPATAGTADLRTAIAEWFSVTRNVDLQAIHADVVPTVGSKEGVALMASLLHFGEDDVVVQPKVSYPTYEIGTQLAGAKVLKVDDVADVASWRNVPGVKAVWVNSPCNPTGEVHSAERMAGIVVAAREIGAVVLSDECYALMQWRDAVNDAEGEADSLASTPCALCDDVCLGSAEGVLVLYSLSKQSNMAGYRTALIAGDRSLIGPMAAYRKQIGQIIPGPVQAAMAAGLRDFDAVKTQHSRYQERLGMLVSALRAYGYCTDMPQGALYVWVKAKSGDCWEDLRQLAEIGIVASPGEFYGAPEYLRFSATASDAAIASAAERLAR